MILLDVANDRLNGLSSFQFPGDLWCYASFGTRQEDLDIIALFPVTFMALVTLVNYHSFEPGVGQSFNLLNLPLECMTIIGSALKRLTPDDELACCGAFGGGGERDLVAELITLVGLSL